MSTPHSAEAEASVVGGMLASPKVIGEIVGTLLEPQHFHVPAFRALFHEIVSAYYADEPVDALVIGELCAKTLSRTWKCEESAAVAQVKRLAAENAGAGPELTAHATIIKRHADYRALLELGSSVLARVQMEVDAPDEIAAEVSQIAMQIATSTLSTQEVVGFEELARRFVHEQRMMATAAEAGVEVGAYFGLKFLDNYLQGLRPGELWFLAGEPGAGKSAVSWVAAQRFAERQLRKPRDRWIGTLVCSLEMGVQQSAGRYAQAIGRIEGERIRRAKLSATELADLAAAFKARRELPLFHSFASTIRLAQLRALVVEAIRRHNTGLVIIDHWKYVESDRRYRNSWDEDEAKAKFLKQSIAKDLNVAVVCLGHTTKAPGQRDDPRPRMADLRGSGYVQAHADFISFVHRPYKYATPKQIADGKVQRTDAEMLWEKTRHSAEGTATFFFDPSTMTVR